MLKITNLYKTFHPGTVNAKTALDGLNLELQEPNHIGDRTRMELL